jgi:hypothetical protein
MTIQSKAAGAPHNPVSFLLIWALALMNHLGMPTPNNSTKLNPRCPRYMTSNMYYRTTVSLKNGAMLWLTLECPSGVDVSMYENVGDEGAHLCDILCAIWPGCSKYEIDPHPIEPQIGDRLLMYVDYVEYA